MPTMIRRPVGCERDVATLELALVLGCAEILLSV